MCGINGFSWSNDSLIQQMNLITKNRGPDDIGVYSDKRITLGHTRLSIIDLSDNGHQPMSNEDQSIWITYNGEIYNFYEIRYALIKKGHIFKSKTDTEVIIHAYEEYGFDFVNLFNGMWAFCLYDKNKNVLVLSRDQFGIKPLYYYLDKKQIIFSSMISAILCHDVPTLPYDKAIMNFLSYNLEDHENYTFFSGINKVPSHSLFIYDLSKKTHTEHRWYTTPQTCNATQRTIKELFVESIKLRTISDVPIGSCLSGGIDSSAIVCTLNTILNDTFNTFSLINPGYIKYVGSLIFLWIVKS